MNLPSINRQCPVCHLRHQFPPCDPPPEPEEGLEDVVLTQPATKAADQ